MLVTVVAAADSQPDERMDSAKEVRLGFHGCLEMACFAGLGVLLALPLSPPKLWSDILNSTQPPSQAQALPGAIVQSAIAAAWN
jgi:hypothetical protein